MTSRILSTCMLFMLLLPPTCVNAAPGNSAPGSRGRIDVSSTVQLEPVAHCGHPGWLRDHPKYRTSLSSHSEPLISDVWTAFTISFTPLADGEISLILMGRDGGQDPATDVNLRFTLRRNQPQIANVDMAVVESTLAATGFQFMTTSTVVSPQIDNSTFNYYVVASTIASPCSGCSVGFCRVSYTEGAP